MEGPDPEMDELVDSLQRKMNGYIREIERQKGDATGEFPRFCIKH